MTTYIVCAFVSGFLLSTVIFWIVTRQLQKDWQAEYRRLMSAICRAMVSLNKPGVMNSKAFDLLNTAYRGNNNGKINRKTNQEK